MSAREEEEGPSWRSKESAVDEDAVASISEEPPPTTARGATSTTTPSDEKDFRDAVVALSQRVVDSSETASGSCSRQLEHDLSRLHDVLIECKNAATNTPPLRPTAWKEEVRPILERCLLAALAAAAAAAAATHRQELSPVELQSPVAPPISNNVPLDVVDGLLALDPAIALLLSQGRQTVLHLVAVSSSSPPPAGDIIRKSDLVRHILRRVGGRVAATLVESSDPDGMRPIDTLTAQILMKEERLKYRERRRRHRSSSSDNQNPTGRVRGGRLLSDDSEAGKSALLRSDLDDSWECARLIATVHAGGDAGGRQCWSDMPAVHACLAASSSVPRALLESALRRYPEHLHLPDALGNLPLHHAAAAFVVPRAESAARVGTPPSAAPAAASGVEVQPRDYPDEEDEAEDEEEDVLPRILSLHRGAARLPNWDGHCPVDMAVRAGRRWRTGIAELGAAHPEALLDLNRQRPLLPQLVVLLRSDRHGNDVRRPQAVDILYRVVRASPNAVLPIRQLMSVETSAAGYLR